MLDREIERLRGLPRLKDVKGKATILQPLPGFKRIRCLVGDIEVNPTNMFDERGRTNWDRLMGLAGGVAAEPVYTDPIETA